MIGSQSAKCVAFIPEKTSAYIYASVVQSTAHYLTVRLFAPSDSAALLSSGTRMQVVFEEQPQQFHQARLHHRADDLLTLQWEAPMPIQETREHMRYTWEHPVSYRCDHGGGVLSAWHSAHCIDISLGGMGLQLPHQARLPSFIQVWLPLASRTEAASRKFTDDGTAVESGQEAVSLRLSGRVLFPYGISADVVRCGVMFLCMSNSHKTRLRQFLEGLQPSL